MWNIVTATRIIGTSCVVYTAWEPHTGDMLGGNHSTQQTIDGVRMGRIGTRRLPAHLDDLPAGSDERLQAVREWQRTEEQRAYACILTKHPEVATGTRDMGEICVQAQDTRDEAAAPYPVRTLLDVATDHLSLATQAWLANQLELEPDYRVVNIGGMPRGWFVSVPTHSGPSFYGDVPADLAGVFAVARTRGCEFVLFDADAAADVIAGLAVFETEEAVAG